MHYALTEELKRRHHFDKWAGRTAGAESIFVRNFAAAAVCPAGFREQTVEVVEAQAPPVLKTAIMIWRRPGSAGDEAFRTDIIECASTWEAHDVLIQVLANFQTPVLYREEAGNPGDVSFATPNAASKLFARGNVVCVVRSIGQPAPAAPVAEAMDREVIARPLSIPLGPQKRARMAGVRNLRPGAGVRVSVEYSPSTCVKMFSAAGDFHESGGEVMYTPRAPGPHEIEVFLIQPGGVTEKARMRVQVRMRTE